MRKTTSKRLHYCRSRNNNQLAPDHEGFRLLKDSSGAIRKGVVGDTQTVACLKPHTEFNFLLIQPSQVQLNLGKLHHKKHFGFGIIKISSKFVTH